MRGAVLALAAILLAGCGSEAQSEPARREPAKLPHSGSYVLGAQTHFGQGWPSARLSLAERIGIGHLRDGLAWAAAEKVRGTIVFPPDRLQVLRGACRSGVRLVMTAAPRNPLYDGDNIVSSVAGRAAFLAYLAALLDALPGCIDALEIGNEINGARALPVHSGLDGQRVYAELLAAIRHPLRQRAPDVALLGGSTNVVGTGFLDQLFALKLLDNVDGIAVHPYRGHAENLDWELGRLADVMARHGKRVPVWATEFSDNFAAPELAAPALLKMVTVMGASGVERAYWYALSDQRWFRNMGLYDSAGTAKPAARAFGFVRRELVARGRPIAVSRDPLLRLYRYGEDRWVIWGAPRPLRPTPGSRFHDAEGRTLSPPADIGFVPIVISGPRPQFGESPVLADSLFEYGSAPWRYVALAGGEEQVLTPLDGRFTTSFGSRHLRPLFLSDAAGAPAGTPERPIAAIVRYAAPGAMTVQFQACLSASANPLHASVSLDGRRLAGTKLRGHAALAGGPIEIAAGGKLDLAIGPASSAGTGNRFRYRIRLFRAEVKMPPCPADLAGWSDA